MTFLIATENMHKKEEFERILAPLGIKIKTAKELGIELPEVEENGETFEENALLKARSGAEILNLPTLSDDSGICIDFLNGAPGIYSARYAYGVKKENSDIENNKKVLRELQNVPIEKRTAHYACAVACVFPDGREITTYGECHGHIGFEERGENGFGYDPLFLVNVKDGAVPNIPIGVKSFGECTAEEKDKVSHRGRALKKIYEALKEVI